MSSEYGKEIEEAFKHPPEWEKMSEHEKNLWAMKQTMLISKLSQEQVNASIQKRVEKRKVSNKHVSGLVIVLAVVIFILAVKGVLHPVFAALSIIPILLVLRRLYYTKWGLKFFSAAQNRRSKKKVEHYQEEYERFEELYNEEKEESRSRNQEPAASQKKKLKKQQVSS